MDYPESKTAPWSHQITAWKLIQKHPAFYLAHEMGVGKSKIVVDACTGFNAKKILIICPKKVIGVWPKQFEIHSARNVEVIPLVKGTSVTKAALIDKKLRTSNGQPQAFIINYESCFRSPIGPTINKYKKITKPGILLGTKWDMLVADEAHRIKSPGGRASWQLYRLGKVNQRKLFLSGTPMPASPLDLYAQYRALNPKIFACNFTQFRARYAVMGGYLGKQIFEYQNIDDLNKRMFSIAHEVLADNVLDLPPRVNREVYYDLKPSTMKIYKSLEIDFIAQWDQGEIVADNILVKLLRLAELSCGIATNEDGRKSIIDTSKADQIMDFLEDLPQNEPVAIYCKFTPELQLIKKMLQDSGKSVAEVSGRMDELELWQDGHRTVIVLQIDAGSEGIDLTRARYCLYSNMGLKLGVYLQSRKRIRRPGQNQKVFYYHFLGNRTIEIANFNALKDKKTIVDFFLRGIHQYKIDGIAPKSKRIRGLALSQILEGN